MSLSAPAHKKKLPACPRLWVIVAAAAPMAVVIRRGPSNCVRLVLWNMEGDRFERGQWFKGRIYDQKCDLSHDGKYFIYFAAKYGRSDSLWSALSRPPFFTALAHWPFGSTYGGGGYFVSADSFVLRHGPYTDMAPGFKPCKLQMLEDTSKEGMPGWTVMKRGGWKIMNNLDYSLRGEEAMRAFWPQTWQKPHPLFSFTLEVATNAFRFEEEKEPVYRIFSPEKEIGSPTIWNWADWDSSGDLLYACDGKLFRAAVTREGLQPGREIADFNGETFSEIAPPPEACAW